MAGSACIWSSLSKIWVVSTHGIQTKTALTKWKILFVFKLSWSGHSKEMAENVLLLLM